MGNLSLHELKLLLHEARGLMSEARMDVLFLDELDYLYHLRTGEHLVGGLNKRLERGYERNKEVLLGALIQIAEKNIEKFKLDVEKYPRFKQDFEENIKRLEKIISRLSDC